MATPRGWRALPRRNGFWVLDRPGSVSYRFRLREAARALRRSRVAYDFGTSVTASPSLWLLRVRDAPRDTTHRVQVRAPEGVRVASVHRREIAPDLLGGIMVVRPLGRPEAEAQVEELRLGPGTPARRVVRLRRWEGEGSLLSPGPYGRPA